MTDTEPQNPTNTDLVERVVSILATDQTVEMPMLSGSMLPLLPPAAVITIARLDWRECRPGMICVFLRDDTLVAHRLLLTCLPGQWSVCYQKGDNNPLGQWISAKRIIGVVTGVTYSNGSRMSLHTPAEIERARHTADDSLRSDLGYRVLYWPRRIKSWLIKTPKNSASR